MARLERRDPRRELRHDRRQERLAAEVVDQVDGLRVRLVDLLVEVEVGLVLLIVMDQQIHRLMSGLLTSSMLSVPVMLFFLETIMPMTTQGLGL